jgi:histidinol dehydrogenase
MKIIKYQELNSKTVSKPEPVDTGLVRQIIKRVKEAGDAALKEYTLRYDGVNPVHFKIEKEAFSAAYRELDKDIRSALETAADHIRIFAEKQLSQLQDFRFQLAPGVFTGQRVVPLERVGVYVPGGNFPLVSSLLMGAVPARTAGVPEVAVCTPSGPGGRVHPAMLAAAAIAGIDEFYPVGGVQAIAALAYGTETVKAVDKIVGPGNAYVAAAKKEVYGDVGIDFIAGPSEVMIIADESANAAWIAADLLAQAEHDTGAVPVLVTPSKQLALRVNEKIRRQLSLLDTREIAAQAIENNGLAVLVDSLEQAVDIANRQAPEHLELHLEEPDTYIDSLKNYGSLFIGHYAAEVLGDYSSGLNHILPTAGAARYSGGLSVRDFVNIRTILETDKQGIAQIGEHARQMARLEGLTAHANAVTVRLAGPET